MPVPVYLPKFNPSHEESLILGWIVQEGDLVRAGDPVCEVETDKVNMEVEAPQDGRLAGIRYQAGDTAPAAEIIAYLLLDGETEQNLPGSFKPQAQPVPASPPQPAAPAAAISPVAQRLAAARAIDLQTVQGSGPRGRIMRRDLDAQTAEPAASARVRATPAARHLARQRELDLTAIAGSGPRGRRQAADVLAALPSVAPETAPTSTAAGVGERYPLNSMRARIALRMQQSMRDAPHIYVEMPVSMDAALAARQQLKTEGEEVSLTAFLVKACARALARHPHVNSTFDGEQVTVWPQINIGIAVALDGGLIVPTLFDADSLPLSAVQRTSADLIARARQGQLSLDEISGATFTISNMGMFGVSRFTAIINPPQVAILAVGGIQKQFVPDEHNQPAMRSILTLVLSVDHRVLDGVDAARFLHDLRLILENPVRLAW